jgi:hypothetical protein
MTLTEMKKKILGMIEELDIDETSLTSDQDIETKLNDTINQVMFELARMKKIPDYVEMEVTEGDLVRFEDIANASGFDVYQIDRVRGVDFEFRANGTIIKVMESGTLEIDYFKYPERITEKTSGNYEFELSQDALEILPYGVAGDLLKTDVSTEYGKIFSDRYELMLSRLDPRNAMGTFSVKGGVTI